MLLALLVLLASIFTAKAEEDPYKTSFVKLNEFVTEAMELSYEQQGGEVNLVNYEVMAHSVTDYLRSPQRYGTDQQKLAAVCWNITGLEPIQGPNGEPLGYEGDSLESALGVCNTARPPPPECWETGGTVGVRLEHLALHCVVFFSPHGEGLLSREAAMDFQAQTLATAR